MSPTMYVPSPTKPPVHRALRYLAWQAGDLLALAVSRITGFRVPDEPLQPFLLKLPMLLGTYERETVAALRKLVKPGMTVIDGGAHVGYYTRKFSELVGPTGRVLAFEIHPRTLQLLRHNTRSLRNVEIIPAALGDRDSVTTIYECDALSSGHSATASKPGLRAGGEIIMRSLESILRERGLERADFLKLDIEGGEPAVLRSLPDKPITIVFEVKRYILEAAGETPEGLLAELLDKGYELSTVAGEAISGSDLKRTSTSFHNANIVGVRRGARRYAGAE